MADPILEISGLSTGYGDFQALFDVSLALQERAGGDDHEILMYGRYDDKLVLTGKGWKFKERRLTVYRFKPVTDAS